MVAATRIARVIIALTMAAYIVARLRDRHRDTLHVSPELGPASPAIPNRHDRENTTSDISDNMTRRADGELETDVLRALWNLDRPASPSDVIEEMNTELAYTSIATTLMRLCEKGLATRSRAGRAYVDVAANSEVDLTAQRIGSVLDAASDRQSALAGFAKSLDPAEAAQLAALLSEDQR
jgi:predicted transcriptional regulator